MPKRYVFSGDPDDIGDNQDALVNGGIDLNGTSAPTVEYGMGFTVARPSLGHIDITVTGEFTDVYPIGLCLRRTGGIPLGHVDVKSVTVNPTDAVIQLQISDRAVSPSLKDLNCKLGFCLICKR